MTTPEETPGDELTREYRRASEADAGSPAAATRAAILAEARAAALRRTPAANDSRYLWRAAAGIAVLGVAVILWRQAHHDLAADLAAATHEKSTAVTAPPAAPATPAPLAEPAPAVEAAPPADVARADKANSGAVAANRAAPAPPAAEPPAAPATRAARAREEAETSTTAMSEASQANLRLARVSADAVAPSLAASAAQAAGAIGKDGIDYQQLLKREFPEVWNGNEPPHIVWVVVDATGKVLRKGGLSPGATITRDQPFESGRPWQMVGVTTASGSSLQLAVMTVN